MESQKILLTYGSATLRNYDIQLVRNNEWLNDQIIIFFYEYLSNKYSLESNDIVLMDACAAAELQYTDYTNDDENLLEMYGPLHLERAQLILLPVNDNTNKLKANAGSHWSLLAFVKD